MTENLLLTLLTPKWVKASRSEKMLLRNRDDGQNYRVRSEDYEGGIRIFAVAEQTGANDFVRHYHTLDELLDEWEDAD